MTVMLALVLAVIVNMTGYAKIIVIPNNPTVEVSADGTTLTFFNQSQSYDYQIEDEYSDAPAWCSTKVTKVVFDASFAYATPSSTAHWFSGCTNLKTIEGIEYLRVDSVKRADYMFYGCRSLTTLDLSGFNTYKLTGCSNMFAQCSKLKTIYGNTWNILDNMSTTERQKFIIYQINHSEDNYMFDGCTSLVGGSGTKYDASIKNKDYTYCHIDGGTENPGFFTRKTATLAPYAVLDNGLLTLYYDDLRHEHVGNKFDITFGEAPGYSGNKSIKEINIDISMSRLAPTSMASLFENLYEVVTIRNIGNLNTSRVTDMSGMFFNCCSLIVLDLSGLKTQNVTNMASMFGHCFSLNYVNLSSLNTANVTNMANMFYRCMSLKSVNFGSFNTSNVTVMSGMFNECLSLQTLDLSSFYTARVTTMASMFRECVNLQTLNISSFNTANVTDMSYMFNKCRSLQDISLNNFNTTKVTNMTYMFGQPMIETVIAINPQPEWGNYSGIIRKDIQIPDYKLETIDISSFNTANVTNMSGMFEFQPALTTIYVGNSWSTANVSSSDNMFSYSDKLVGGNGTTYDANHVDHLYAHVDGGINNPGYLTLKDSQGDTGIKAAYAVLDNGTLTFYYDGNKDSRTGKKYDVEVSYTSSNLPGWAADSLSIKNVAFNASFACYSPTSTAYWFGGYYNNLSAIYGMRNLNTTNVTNMDNMFTRCRILKNIDLSYFNTSKVTNMQSMFYGCSSLTSLDLSGFDTKNVTNMYGMFYSCRSLTKLDVSSFETQNVKYMNFMFNDCCNLTSIDVTHFNTEKVTNMKAMFQNCSKLQSLELRNFNTSNVVDMGWMFNKCSSLTALNISTFKTDKVTMMNSMFYNCQKLTSIDVSGFNTSNVTNMAYMFGNCSSLKQLYVGGFYTNKVTEMQSMFNGCSALTTIYAKDTWNTSKVTNSANMFTNCSKLVGGAGTIYNSSNVDKAYAHIDGGTSNAGYFTDMAPAIASGTKAYAVYNNNILTFYYDNKSSSRVGTKYEVKASYGERSLPGWVYDYNRRTLTKAVFDSSFASYQPTSTAYWFYQCDAMTTIEGIANLKTSKVTSMAEMFRYCNVLNNLDLRTFDTSNVTDMKCMFCYCFKLSNLYINGFNTAKVTNMSHMFHCCPMESLDVSSFNTSSVTDMSIMFAECKNLKTLNLKNFNTAKVVDMSYMFVSCEQAKDINVSSFNTSNVENMYAMFAHCYQLNELNLRSFNTAKVSIMERMFYLCPNLMTIYASNLWSTASISLGSGMFTYDIKLVGSMGTTYNSAHTDHAYAHIDGGRCNPGYLYGDIIPADLGPKEAYAVLDDGVLTFYYDSFKECTDGKIYPIENGYSYAHLPAWHEDRSQIMIGAFDSSFADYRPTNTSYWFFELDQMTALNDVVNLNTSEVSWMTSMFGNCHSLRALDVSNFNTAKVKTMSGMFGNCRLLSYLDVSHFNTANVEDMGSMFWGCNSLIRLDVSNFNTAEVKNMYGMFYDCKNLKTIDVSKFNTANVENMAVMFMRCQVLENLNLKNFNTAKVTNMEMMFYICYKLQSLDVSSFNTSNVTNMRSMFDCLKSVKKLDLSNFNTSKVTNMQSMFSGCDVLEEVDVSSFDTRNVTDMTGMFHDLGKMKTVDISNFNTAKVELMEQMFCDSPELTTIYAGDRWTTSSVTNSQDMFTASKKLVGGAGTKYDSNHIDHAYARIDGGTSRPGYFTKKLSCDVNSDGNVDVADIASIIDVMAGGGSNALKKRADVNGDGNVDVADIATVITRMAELARRQQILAGEQE